MPPEAPKRHFPNFDSLLGTPFESRFLKISCFLQEIIMFFHCVFKALFLCSFLCVFEQVGTVKTIKNIAQGSKNSVCIKSLKIGPGPGLGWMWESFFGAQLAANVVFCRKNECNKTSWKKVPPKSETSPDGHVPGLPDSPPKVKDCLSNKQQLNKKQQQ